MDFENPIVWATGGLIALVAIVFLTSYFSAEVRLERRRRKSNARIVNTTNRPTVQFTVRTKDSKK